jgi:hypothetical protein
MKVLQIDFMYIIFQAHRLNIMVLKLIMHKYCFYSFSYEKVGTVLKQNCRTWTCTCFSAPISILLLFYSY